MADAPFVGGAKSKRLTSRRKGIIKPGSFFVTGTLSARPHTPPRQNPLVVGPSAAEAAAFVFPAIPEGKFNTIYELVAAYAPTFYAGTGAVAGPAAIYAECVKMLALFAMADVRHDFQSELDIDIYTDLRGENIGTYLCRLVCGAFYAVGSARFNDLLTFTLRAYAAHMASDATAKKFILDYLNMFYNTVIVPNRVLFTDTAYSAPYDTSSKGTYIYETGADLATAYTVITNDNPVATNILVDAQMGNPLEKIFSGRTQANVIYNFTSAMDAASKPIATMHTYLNAYVQAPFAANTTAIPQHLTSFGVQFTPVDFAYDGEWKTRAQIQLGDHTLTESFGPRSKASVDELALVPVRAGMTRQEIQEEVAKLSKFKLSQHQLIAANHIFKSLGDRLQSALIMKIYKHILRYHLNGNLTQNNIAPGAIVKKLGDADNCFEFTNDILASVQNYLMQVNTVFTGNKQVVIYIYNTASALTEGDVTKHFIDNKVALHAAINTIKKPASIADPESLLLTLFDAFAANSAFSFCEKHFLFRLFTGAAIPLDDHISAAITKDNYKTLISFQDNIQRLREVSIPPEISRDAFNSNIRAIISNINTLNKEAEKTNLDSYSINTLYNSYALVATSLEHYLTYCIPAHTFILTHLLIKLLAPNVSRQLYDNNIFSNSLLTFGRGSKLINVYSQAIKGYFTEGQGDVLREDDGVFGQIFARVAALAVTPTLAGINTAIDTINRFAAAASEKIKSVYSFLAPYANIGIVINALKGATPAQLTELQRAILTANGFTPSDVAIALVKTASRKELPKSTVTKASAKHPKSTTAVSSKSKRALAKMKLIRTKKGDAKKGIKTVASAFKAPLERHPRAERIRGMTAATFSEPKYIDIEYISGGKIVVPDKSILSNIKAGFGKLLTVSISGLNYYITNIRRTLFGQRGTQKAGGSRSAKRVGAEELALLKVGFIEHIIGRADYRYAAYTHYMAKNFLDILLGDYYAVNKSRSAPVSIRSLSPQPLSVIVEEEEGVDYNAEGGSRSKTTTVTEGASAAASKQVVTLPGSRIHTFADSAIPSSYIPFSGKGHTLGTIVNPLADRGSVQKLPSGEKIEFITKAEGKEIINQQLLAFFWLGFSRSPEFVEMEKKVFAKLLPAFDISYIGDIQNEIFWQPLLQQIDVPVEDLFTLFERSVLPEFEGKGLTPIRRRLQREIRARAANTRRLPKK
jgi:hypothetical protein